MLGFIKLGISLIKYGPQVILNYIRKETSGFNIYGVILDLTGALLSYV